MMRTSEGGEVRTLEEYCQALAPMFAELGLPAPTATDVLELLQNEKTERVMKMRQQLQAQCNRRHERGFLRDEKGNAYGHVVAEIPEELYMDLRSQKDFGEALNTPEGIQEVLKAFPACRTKAVGTKYIGRGFGQKALGSGRGRSGRVNFGAGTLVGAVEK